MTWDPNNPAEGLRRIVTGHDAEGKSIVVIDGPPAGAAGALREIWQTEGALVDSRGTDDAGAGPVVLSPPSGGSKCRWFILPPRDPNMSKEDLEAYYAAGFAAMNASHERVDTSRDPAMHKTKTIDYIVLLSGRVTLMLDKEERELKPFDVVVQRGTNHAWINTGNEPAIFIGVLIDAEVS